MKDDAYRTCPKELCRRKTWGKGKVKRLLGAGAGLIFKGSGFYITDYRSSGYAEAAKKESSGGETKSEAKRRREGRDRRDKTCGVEEARHRGARCAGRGKEQTEKTPKGING